MRREKALERGWRGATESRGASAQGQMRRSENTKPPAFQNIGSALSPGGKLTDIGKSLLQPGTAIQILQVKKSQIIFAQGNPAHAAFYLHTGRVRLAANLENGKESTFALLVPGDFFGESALCEQPPTRLTSAVALTDCTLYRVSRAEMLRLLDERPDFQRAFMSCLLERMGLMQASILNQRVNSTARRLAGTLVALAQHENSQSTLVIPRLSQELLASMAGTTRSRVNLFMNRFKNMGLIEYGSQIKLHPNLLKMALRE